MVDLSQPQPDNGRRRRLVTFTTITNTKKCKFACFFVPAPLVAAALGGPAWDPRLRQQHALRHHCRPQHPVQYSQGYPSQISTCYLYRGRRLGYEGVPGETGNGGITVCISKHVALAVGTTNNAFREARSTISIEPILWGGENTRGLQLYIPGRTIFT